MGGGTFLDVNMRRVPDMIGRERTWKLVSTATGLLGGLLGKKLIRSSYRAISKKEPRSAFDPTSDQF
jgi:hypothetical protein